MKMQLETSEANLISAYGPGEISVNGVAYRENILITADKIIERWHAGPLESLAIEAFEPLLVLPADERPEVVVLGSGDTHRFPDFKLLAELKQQGLSVEVMTTHAACRTYSVLVNEYRPVAAALLQLSAAGN